MDKETSLITAQQFHTILSSVDNSQDAKENSAHLVLFVHRVEDYESGLYIFVRNQRDKELYWECGMIGQQLYLEATSLGLSGTGIGCFLDDTMHNLLGLKNNYFQTLYHFTVGRGYVDSRILTKPAYK